MRNGFPAVYRAPNDTGLRADIGVVDRRSLRGDAARAARRDGPSTPVRQPAVARRPARRPAAGRAARRFALARSRRPELAPAGTDATGDSARSRGHGRGYRAAAVDPYPPSAW